MNRKKFKRIILFLRKKIEGQNSIEELAYTLSAHIPDMTIVNMPESSRSIIGMMKNVLFAIRKQGDVNLIFSPSESYIVPFLKNRTIITYHDIGTMLSSSSWYVRWFRKLTNLTIPLKFTDSVICISKHTQTELCNMFPSVSKKTNVIYNPYNPLLRYSPKRFDSDMPLILHIGTVRRKNLLRVIEALDGIRCRLHIVGKVSEEQEESLVSHHIDYRQEMDVDFQRIIELYGQCDIVSFPTLYEGFGMPIIEANAVGRVVLTSKVTSIPEIAGDAACFIDPYDVSSIRDGFIRLINEQKFRDKLINYGLENVRRFHIDRIVCEYKKILGLK